MARTFTDRRRSAEQAGRISRLQEDIKEVCGQVLFGASPALPADVQEADLEDVLAFESVGKGVSLFEGLRKHGLDLPHPDKLNEKQSRRKSIEVLNALADLRIFLTGIEGMSGGKLYRTLWEQTLWEGCYVRKRNPAAITMIDVSRSAMRSKTGQLLDGIFNKAAIH